ncbi:MAG: hypothetical protein P8Z68_03895 [Kineosporiaceae bacterium]|jgi:hypothetical protein
MGWGGWVLGIVVAVLAVDRLALWAEGRGWIYWRRVNPRPVSGAWSSLGLLIEALHPSHSIVVEEQRFRELRVDETRSSDGGPVDGGRPGPADGGRPGLS